MKKNTVAALAVFVVLLGVVLATRQKSVAVGIKHLELPKLDKAKISRLELTGPMAATLEKSGEAWTVRDPKQPDKSYPADKTQVTAAIDSLVSFKAMDLVTENDKRHEEFELNDAKGLKLKVSLEGGASQELIFGKSAKSGGNYVRAPGEAAVFVSKNPLGWMLRKDVKGWRQRSLLTAKLDEITELTVRPADGTPWSAKAGENGSSWTLSEGVAAPAGFRFDPAAPQRIAQQLANLSAQDFVDGALEPANSGLGSPTVVQAKLKDGKSVQVKLGRPVDSRENGLVHPLLANFDALDADKNAKLSMGELAAGAAGTFAEDAKKAISWAGEVDAFDRLDVGVYGGRPKDGAIDKEDLGAASRTIGTVPAQLEGDSQIYLIASFVASGLSKRLEELRDTSLMAFEAPKVVSLAMDVGGKRTRLTKEGEAWKVQEPAKLPDGYELDSARVNAQLQALRTLRGARVIDGVVAAKVGLAKPGLLVELKTDDGKAHSVRFGAELTSSTGAKEYYVQGTADGLLYVISAAEKTRLEGGLELFKKMPAPDLSKMGPINGLDQLPPEVRAQLEAQMRQKR